MKTISTERGCGRLITNSVTAGKGRLYSINTVYEFVVFGRFVFTMVEVGPWSWPNPKKTRTNMSAIVCKDCRVPKIFRHYGVWVVSALV